MYDEFFQNNYSITFVEHLWNATSVFWKSLEILMEMSGTTREVPCKQSQTLPKTNFTVDISLEIL